MPLHTHWKFQGWSSYWFCNELFFDDAGKHHYKYFPFHLSIAQIAIGVQLLDPPPPVLKRALWGIWGTFSPQTGQCPNEMKFYSGASLIVAFQSGQKLSIAILKNILIDSSYCWICSHKSWRQKERQEALFWNLRLVYLPKILNPLVESIKHISCLILILICCPMLNFKTICRWNVSCDMMHKFYDLTLDFLEILFTAYQHWFWSFSVCRKHEVNRRMWWSMDPMVQPVWRSF